MTPVLDALAAQEENPRHMPVPQRIWQEHSEGRVEEIPMTDRTFLMTCGIEALYLICQELDLDERFTAETKEELADLIVAKTSQGTPDPSLLSPPQIPPMRPTARQKHEFRNARREFKVFVKEGRKSQHGVN